MRDHAATLPALGRSSGKSAADAARNGVLISPSVREAASLISASADEVRVARAALFPSLSLSLGGGVGDAGQGDAAVDLVGEQQLTSFGDTERAIKVADLDLQLRFLEFQTVVDETLSDVLFAVQDVAMHKELLSVRTAHLRQLRNLEGLVAARIENGASTRTEALEARSRVQAAEFTVLDTELALAEARDKLYRLSGQSEGARIDLIAGSCGASALSEEMVRVRLEFLRSRLELERAERARLPRITASPLVRGDLEDGSTSFGLNIGVRSDVLEGGALTARARAARNALAAAAARVETVALEQDLEERGLTRSLTTGAQRVGLLERQIALLAETRDLYRNQYFDLGTRRLAELLEQEQDYSMRSAELVEERADLIKSRIRCAVREGTLRGQLDIEAQSLYGFPLAFDPV
ncbi:outer membrane protein, adhesin transport system [Roseivivax marinus]|uniref:TolC family protein n=1 Tax=Roseivivax marinus TaxID=1379903 RepID=UPI0008BCE091|nr:TolC family protein [Roseivivax marinus]SEL93167.1 outer membrane protein, adhesin transport system [Roseivivax marinus]